MSTAGTVDLPLEIFSGYVPEIAPSDLPAGASPNCQDVQFPLGSWKTRAGLGGGVFAALAGNPTINYQKTYVDRQQNKRFLFLDSTGSVNQEFPQGAVTLGINAIPTVGSTRAKSATAYGSEFIAFSDGNFGVGDPAQWNGQFYDRVSQVGPGAPPTAIDTALAGPDATTAAAVLNNVVTLTMASNPIVAGFLLGAGIQVTGFTGADTYFNGSFQITGITAGTISYALIHVNASASTNGSVSQAGNIVAGIHMVTVFFITRSGYWTKPAVAPTTWTAAGGQQVTVTNIPTGPPNVVARVLIFTEAGGATFFFTTNASSELGNGNMVINDNVTTTAIVDFSDTILASGANAQYLFNLLELEESAGVVSYATRLFWWGGLNRVPNFINMSIDGGFGGIPAAATSGPNNSTAAVNGAGAGSPWTFTAGALPATCVIGVSRGTQAMFATGFGFAIPLNATINGITMVASVKCSTAGDVSDGSIVFLTKDGVSFAGVNHANSVGWSTAFANQTYGSAGDLWGTSLTPAEVNASTFGVAYDAFESVLGQTAFVQSITITVAYTAPGASTVPLGWTAGANSAGGGSANANTLPVVFGDAYVIEGDGATAIRGQITQTAYEDWLGNPILQQTTSYGVRVKLALADGLARGLFHVNLQSNIDNFTTSGLAVQAAQLTASYQVFTGVLTTALTTIPTDLLLQVYADGTPTNGGFFLVEDLEVYPLNQPYLNTTMRASYGGQPESYDELTGVLQPFFQDGGVIRNAFVLREKLYICKDNAWYVTQDDGSNEPSAWTITVVSLAVGCCGIQASDLGEDWGIIANRAGPYIFWGSEPVKIGQEIESDSSLSGKPTWSSINWDFGYTIWVLLDRVNKRALIGAPINGATSPNIIFYFDYVGLDTAQEVADHWSVKYSAYTGKILAIGNAPKWAPWNIGSNSGALIERSDGTAHTFIGNGSVPPASGPGPFLSGKIYDLLDSNKDDGPEAGIPWSYSTYLTPSHMEEQALQIKSHRKLYSYLSGFARGNGLMSISLQPMGNITPSANLPLQLVDPTVTKAVSTFSRVNGVTTVTCLGGHGLTAGIDVQAVIQNAPDPSFNGTFPIFQILSPTEFTISQYLLPDLNLSGSGLTFNQTVIDNFNRPNEAPLDPTKWTNFNIGSGLAVLNDLCVGRDGTGDLEFYTAVVFPNNQFASMTVDQFAVSSEAGVWVRSPVNGVGGYFAFFFGNGAGQYSINLYGNFALGSFVLPHAPQLGDVLTLAAIGPSIYVLYNGVVVIGATDSTYTTGSPGMTIKYTATQADTSVSSFSAGSAIGGASVSRLSREFEFTTNTLAERCSYTFANQGNAAGSWCQMEKIIFSIVPDPWAPVRGNPY